MRATRRPWPLAPWPLPPWPLPPWPLARRPCWARQLALGRARGQGARRQAAAGWSQLRPAAVRAAAAVPTVASGRLNVATKA